MVAGSEVDGDAVDRLLTPGTYWDGVVVRENPAFTQLRVERAREATREEQLLTRGITAAERLHRQGIAVNVDTLTSEDESVPESVWRELAGTPLFRKALEDRGIPMLRPDGLTPLQLSALEFYYDPVNAKRRPEWRLQAIGVTGTQWHNWMRIPAFAAYRQLHAEEALADSIPDALAGIVNGVNAGQKWAIEMALEVTGRHDRRTTGPSLQELVTLVFMVLDDAGTPEATMQQIAAKLRTRMGLQAGAAPASQPVLIAQPALEERAG